MFGSLTPKILYVTTEDSEDVCCVNASPDVSERTTSNVAERQEGVQDVTQEVEVPQQVSAVAAGPGKQLPTLPVRNAEVVVADVPDVHQEVEHVPQSASCRSGFRQGSYKFETFKVFKAS